MEYAARGGRDGEDDWSSAFDADGKPIANTWLGIFPVINTKDDGYAGTAPVGCFKPNGYGLYDMIGNVWEWTSDWYRPGHASEAAIEPQGPSLADILAPGQAPSKVIKGGSFLCAFNYCARYRPAARQPQEVDLSAAPGATSRACDRPMRGGRHVAGRADLQRLRLSTGGHAACGDLIRLAVDSRTRVRVAPPKIRKFADVLAARLVAVLQ